MINKEHYQIIRQHPAFAHFPVEIFDKIAIEIQFRKIPKGQIIFFSGDRRDPSFPPASRLCSYRAVRFNRYFFLYGLY